MAVKNKRTGKYAEKHVAKWLNNKQGQAGDRRRRGPGKPSELGTGLSESVPKAKSVLLELLLLHETARMCMDAELALIPYR